MWVEGTDAAMLLSTTPRKCQRVRSSHVRSKKVPKTFLEEFAHRNPPATRLFSLGSQFAVHFTQGDIIEFAFRTTFASFASLPLFFILWIGADKISKP